MGKKLKLIWDFRGPDAQKTAEHQEVHLKEYIENNKLDINITGVETVNDLHTTCYLVVDQEDLIPVRDALKPHRGEWYEEK